MQVDLNADVGDADEAIPLLVGWTRIARGPHAGDAASMAADRGAAGSLV